MRIKQREEVTGDSKGSKEHERKNKEKNAGWLEDKKEMEKE